jgi:hypothetical protein
MHPQVTVLVFALCSVHAQDVPQPQYSQPTHRHITYEAYQMLPDPACSEVSQYIGSEAAGFSWSIDPDNAIVEVAQEEDCGRKPMSHLGIPGQAKAYPYRRGWPRKTALPSLTVLAKDPGPLEGRRPLRRRNPVRN